MTGDDLKHLQDNFLATAKKILLERSKLWPVGFVVTLHKHVSKLFESGWGVEFLDLKSAIATDAKGDDVVTLLVDLAMDWKKLYHAVLCVFPKTRDVLPKLMALGELAHVDDAYKRVMRPFLRVAQMDEKDVVAATMRQICGKVDAFANIFHSEAWMRVADSPEAIERAREHGLAQDAASVEVIVSSMETHDFSRMILVPIKREPSETRDGGKVTGFGEPRENSGFSEGRLTGFLKPLPDAS